MIMGSGCFFGLSKDKANKNTKGQYFRKVSLHLSQCSDSSQIPSKDDCNYWKFLSLYNIRWRDNRNELTICDTENKQKKIKVLDTKLPINEAPSITQLPNGDLFALSYGGTAFIIDSSYRVKIMLPGIFCSGSSALYFENNIYCYGGYHGRIGRMTVSTKFDINKNRWTNLASLPSPDFYCHSVVFNRNILISGFTSKNLWLYSTAINSFSTIPYDFSINARKILINAERLYMIQWGGGGLVYESEDVYNWKQISKLGLLPFGNQIYCLYNKEKTYISIYNKDTKVRYFQFDLKNKELLEFKALCIV